MAQILYTDYTAAKNRVVSFCNTVGYSYSWRYSPSGAGAIATKNTVQELQNVTAACGARVVRVGCNGLCSANNASNYASARNGNWEAYWGTDSGYRWKT